MACWTVISFALDGILHLHYFPTRFLSMYIYGVLELSLYEEWLAFVDTRYSYGDISGSIIASLRLLF